MTSTSDVEHERQSAKAARSYATALAERIAELTAAQSKAVERAELQVKTHADVVAHLHEQARRDAQALLEAQAQLEANAAAHAREVASLRLELDVAWKACQVKHAEALVAAEAQRQARAHLELERDAAWKACQVKDAEALAQAEAHHQVRAQLEAELDALRATVRERTTSVLTLEHQLAAAVASNRELEQVVARLNRDLANATDELQRIRLAEQTSLAMSGLRSLRRTKDRVLPEDSLQRRTYDWLLSRLKNP